MTRLRKILQDRNMTQKELAEKSDLQEYKISQLCSGKSKNLLFSTAMKICSVLKCDVDQAFGDLKLEDN